MVHHIWGESLLGLLFSLGFAGGIWHTATTGEFIGKNGVVYERDSRPIIFWLLTALISLSYLTIVVGMFAAGPFLPFAKKG